MRDASMTVRQWRGRGTARPQRFRKIDVPDKVGLINPPAEDQSALADTWSWMARRPSRTCRVSVDSMSALCFRSQSIPFLNARENVQIAMELNGISRQLDSRRWNYGELGVAERSENMPSMLSGGQQQQWPSARALANRPSILLADEPTAASTVNEADKWSSCLRNWLENMEQE
ncbi:MAG: ATP-binding cassette domain-containing protein [Planctomycetaceae bacterium]